MKAIRWSIQLAALTALLLVLTLVNARADSNSVVLENATGGPFGAFDGTARSLA